MEKEEELCKELCKTLRELTKWQENDTEQCLLSSSTIDFLCKVSIELKNCDNN